MSRLLDSLLTPEQRAECAANDARDRLWLVDSAADAVAKLCATPEGREPIDVRRLDDIALIDGTAAQCLAAILHSEDNVAVTTAARRLRELVLAASSAEVRFMVGAQRREHEKLYGAMAFDMGAW